MQSPKAQSASTRVKETRAKKTSGHLSKWKFSASVFVILAAVGYYLDCIKDRWYVFDPPTLHALAQSAVSTSPNSTEGMISYILTSLHEIYPQHSLFFPSSASSNSSHPLVALSANPPTDPSSWFFNNAGGAMGAVYLIHASITEYLIIFGTPSGTEGHTGLFLADDYFHILVGEQWAFQPGALEKEVYRPGDLHLMSRGVKKQYKMHEGAWAMEYVRGWVPLMLPFGFADALTSTLDVPTIYNTLRITGREIIRNLMIGKI